MSQPRAAKTEAAKLTGPVEARYQICPASKTSDEFQSELEDSEVVVTKLLQAWNAEAAAAAPPLLQKVIVLPLEI